MANREWKPIKQYTDILFEQYKGIAKITINRPEVYNAFRPLTNSEMLDAFDICRERSDIRVIILTGIGDKAFCSGGDQNYKTIGGYKDTEGTPRPSQGDSLDTKACYRDGKRLRSGRR